MCEVSPTIGEKQAMREAWCKRSGPMLICPAMLTEVHPDVRHGKSSIIRTHSKNDAEAPSSDGTLPSRQSRLSRCPSNSPLSGAICGRHSAAQGTTRDTGRHLKLRCDGEGLRHCGCPSICVPNIECLRRPGVTNPHPFRNRLSRLRSPFDALPQPGKNAGSDKRDPHMETSNMQGPRTGY